MPRQYAHVKQYENDIFELKNKGVSNREIAGKYGLELKQIKDLINRHNRRQRKIAAGIALKKKGRPSKDCIATEEDKVADLRYKLNRKDARIKQPEMENELLRDFLKETGRK